MAGIDKTSENISRTIVSMMMVTVVAKILSFTRELFLTYYLGASGISDAYLISQTIPGTIFQFVGNGLTTCFIPVYVGLVSQKGKKEGDHFTNSVVSMILLFSTAVIFLVWLGGDTVVKIFASGFSGETLEYAVLFTRISVCSLYLSTLIYVYNSLLQANGYFTPNSVAAIPNSILVIVSIVLGAKVNILWLPFGTIIAILTQLLCLLPFVKKCQFKLRPNLDFRSSAMREMYGLLLPVIIGVSVNEINVLVDKTVASSVAAGGISSLSYAYSLIMFVQGIFAQTIATVYYPSITRHAKENKKREFQASIDDAISGMLLFLIPITVGCILLAYSVVKLLYGRGAFDVDAINMTSSALMGYAVGCIGYGIREVLSRVFYSLNETKISTRNAIVGMILNIGMNLTLSRLIGVAGLALATSLSSIVTSLLLLHDLKKMEIYKLSSKMKTSLFKMSFAALGMGVIVWVIQKLLINQSTICSFIVSVLAGVIVYFLLCMVFKLDILKNLISSVTNKKKKV